MALTDARLVAFAASSDLEASERFYSGVLGLELIESTPFALLYDVHGTRLRVTRVETVTRAPYTVLGWRVTDVSETIRELHTAGVVFNRYDGFEQDEDGVWTAPSGTRIAWFDDPDGHSLSLEQSP